MDSLPKPRLDPLILADLWRAAAGTLSHNALLAGLRATLALDDPTPLPSALELLAWQCASGFLPKAAATRSYQTIRNSEANRQALQNQGYETVAPALSLLDWQVVKGLLDYATVGASFARLQRDAGQDPLALIYSRIVAARIYARTPHELGQLLDALLALGPPLADKAQTILSVCAGYPGLRSQYLPDIIADLSAEPGADPEAASRLASLLAHAHQQLGGPED